MATPLITRKGSQAYYLDLGDIIGSFTSNDNLASVEPRANGSALSKIIEATGQAGPWLSDPSTAIKNGRWSAAPISIPE